MRFELSLNKKIRVLSADAVHETRRNARVMLSMLDGVEAGVIVMNGLQAVEMAMQHQPEMGQTQNPC